MRLTLKYNNQDSQRTEDAANNQRFVLFQHSNAQPLKAKQGEPGESDHAGHSRDRENGAEQNKTEPAVFRAGQKNWQESLARRKSQERKQSQNRGPIGALPRPIFFEGAFLCFNLIPAVMLVIVRKMRL